MSIAESLATEFAVKGWHWKVGGELVIPSEDDVARVLTSMAGMLESEPNETQVLIGRLIMRKSDGHNDVYLFYGEYNDNKNRNS